MKANRRARLDGDEGGQLLLLSGVVLVLAFLVTALTLTQLGTLEREAADEQEMRILSDYRFLREKVGTTLHDATGPDTNNATFRETFDNMVATFKVVMQEKGYDVIIKLASKQAQLDRSEWSFTQAGWPEELRDDTTAAPTYRDEYDGLTNRTFLYHLRSHNNTVRAEAGMGDPNPAGSHIGWDANNDGIVWTKPCVKDTTNGCIQGAVIYLYLSDSTTRIEEFVVYGFNT